MDHYTFSVNAVESFVKLKFFMWSKILSFWLILQRDKNLLDWLC